MLDVTATSYLQIQQTKSRTSCLVTYASNALWPDKTKSRTNHAAWAYIALRTARGIPQTLWRFGIHQSTAHQIWSPWSVQSTHSLTLGRHQTDWSSAVSVFSCEAVSVLPWILVVVFCALGFARPCALSVAVIADWGVWPPLKMQTAG